MAVIRTQRGNLSPGNRGGQEEAMDEKRKEDRRKQDRRASERKKGDELIHYVFQALKDRCMSCTALKPIKLGKEG